MSYNLWHFTLKTSSLYFGDYIQANGYPGTVINIDQHDYIASAYVDKLKKALLEVSPNYSPAYAEAVSWGGLQGTVVWNNKYAAWKDDIIGKNKAKKGNTATPYARKGTSFN